MKDVSGKLTYKGKEYSLVFNLNVMERIQDAYGTLEAWGALTDGSQTGEPNAKAVIYGFTEMLNEGIDIDNENRDTKEPFLTVKQVGRMISDVGMKEATLLMNNTVIDSTESTVKNG